MLSRAEPGCASLLRHLKVERQRGKRGIFFFDTRFDSVGIEKKLRCCFHESHKATEMIPSVRLFIPTTVAEICQWSQMVPCSFVPVQSSMTAPHCPCAVIHDCAPCGSSPLLEASKGEEPHTCSIVPVQSSMTAPMSHKVTIWLPKEYKRAAWLGSPQLLVDSQHSNISHTEQ